MCSNVFGWMEWLCAAEASEAKNVWPSIELNWSSCLQFFFNLLAVRWTIVFIWPFFPSPLFYWSLTRRLLCRRWFICSFHNSPLHRMSSTVLSERTETSQLLDKTKNESNRINIESRISRQRTYNKIRVFTRVIYRNRNKKAIKSTKVSWHTLPDRLSFPFHFSAFHITSAIDVHLSELPPCARVYVWEIKYIICIWK